MASEKPCQSFSPKADDPAVCCCGHSMYHHQAASMEAYRKSLQREGSTLIQYEALRAERDGMELANDKLGSDIRGLEETMAELVAERDRLGVEMKQLTQAWADKVVEFNDSHRALAAENAGLRGALEAFFEDGELGHYDWCSETGFWYCDRCGGKSPVGADSAHPGPGSIDHHDKCPLSLGRSALASPSPVTAAAQRVLGAVGELSKRREDYSQQWDLWREKYREMLEAHDHLQALLEGKGESP